LEGFTLRVFLIEIETRCHDALIGAQLLDQGLRERNTDLIWYSLRSILIAAASISQLTGGASGARATDRRSLRLVLGVTSSCVLHNRAVRDHAEHIDDRIFRARERRLLRNYVSYNVGPRNAIHIGSQPFLLNFDQTLGIVSFWEDEVSIPEILTEIGRILPLASAARRQPFNVGGLER
jgi:hypothetical protein